VPLYVFLNYIKVSLIDFVIQLKKDEAAHDDGIIKIKICMYELINSTLCYYYN